MNKEENLFWVYASCFPDIIIALPTREATRKFFWPALINALRRDCEVNNPRKKERKNIIHTHI